MRRLAPALPVATILVLFLAQAGCSDGQPQQEVWFVQATDPHLFYEEKGEKKVREHQENLNQQAFEDLLRSLGSLPGKRVKPRFLVITGDFGLDRFAAELEKSIDADAGDQIPTSPPRPAPASQEAENPSGAPPAPWGTPPLQGSNLPDSSPSVASAVEYMTRVLSKSPVKDIYLVPGNNDVGGEAPKGKPIRGMQRFWAEVQEGLAGTGVTLHDLSSCYFEGGPPAGCTADIEGTSYRLVGFPSHSFKKGVEDDRASAQQKQLETLETLVDQARAQNKRVLILTHIAEVDDPHALAEKEFDLVERYPEAGKPKQGDQKDRAAGLPVWAETSPWNVRSVIFEKWKKVVDSSAVAGVLAGHFHDSHREIYQRPYNWSTPAVDRADLRKLYLAPPLSMRFQNQSPIQARGFALFRLQGDDDPERTLFWFDWKQRTFEPEPIPERPLRWTWPAAARWYWDVADSAGDLTRAAVIAIALLAAFLTIVQLWEVPSAKTPLAGPGTQQPPANESGGSSGGLQGNFAKTVLAGLVGMLALSFFESIWSFKELNTRAYYVLLFISFFFGFLILYAILQSLVEALRSRLVTQYPIAPWRPSEPASSSAESGAGKPKENKRPATRRGSRFWQRLSYWRGRIWHWVLSLRIFLLIFFDTFFNVIRGRNQLKTVVFEKTIIDLHWSIVRATDRIREEIEQVLLQALKEERSKNANDEDIRVSISVLSQDEEVLFYVARERGSLARSFDKRSVAWVSVYTGEARWWKYDYKNSDVKLFTNSGGRFPLLPEGEIPLNEYFQSRSGSDYQGFIVLPVPWSHRAAGDAVRKAGIQISFRDVKHMDALFPGIEKGQPAETKGQPDYDHWNSLLQDQSEDGPQVKDPQLRNVLRHSLEILEELFVSFNETVFELYIRPHIRGG